MARWKEKPPCPLNAALSYAPATAEVGYKDAAFRKRRLLRRCDARARAEGYARGLLGRVERKNGWQMSEYLGAANPYAIQHLLGRSTWNADAVRDEIMCYSREHLLADKETAFSWLMRRDF